METFYFKLLLVICWQTLCLAIPSIGSNFLYRLSVSNGNTIMCLSCPPGTHLLRDCTSPQTTGQCQICPVGYFQPNYTNSRTCVACVTNCLHVDGRNSSEQPLAVCEPTKNFCTCENNTCILDSKCPPGKEPAVQATSFQHTICKECSDETYSDVYSSTEMCKPSTKCGQHEVAILNRDKTQDTLCMSRIGDLDNMTTTTPMNLPHTDSDLIQKYTLLFLAISISIISAISFLIIIKRFYKRKIITKRFYKHKNGNRYQPQNETKKAKVILYGPRMSCDSGILEIEEHANTCNYSRQRNDAQTASRMDSEECMEPLVHNIADQSPHDKTEESTNNLQTSLPLGHAAPLHVSSFSLEALEASFTLIKQTEDTKHLAVPFKKSKGSQNLLDDSYPKTLDALGEKTWAMPKTLDDPCKTSKLPQYFHGPPDENNVLPKIRDEHTKMVHSSKRKTILSTDWQRCEPIDNQGCILQLPNSDVITTFPPGFLADGGSSYCYKTVHNDIPSLTAALHLQNDDVITSPVPEYDMQAAFAQFVQIQIPHRMPKNYKHIQVHSFSNHDVNDTVDLNELKRFDDKTEVDDDIDMFFVANSEFVVIYTKHFSGFVCTTCGKYIEYTLNASVYERQGVLDGQTDTLDVLLYFKSAKASISDFRVTVDERFHHLETKEVKLLEKHEQSEGGQLQFRFYLIRESVRIWMHRKANNDDQLQDDLVLVDPETLMRQCETHIICSPSTKWYLERDDETHRNCDFYVEIIHKEKPASAMDTLRLVKTYIPACATFEVSGALAAASEQGNPIPGPITDVVLTLKDRLNQEQSLTLVKHMGCLQQIPPTPTRRQREDFRFDYWYSAFLACYDCLKGQFIIRVMDGLRKMGLTDLENLVCIHAPQNARIAFIPPNRQPVVHGNGSHIAQPSSAPESGSSDK